MIILWGLLAFISGVLVTISSILNAQAGKKVGIYRAALFNNIFGALVVLIIILLMYGNLSVNPGQLREIPLWVYGGGIVTILVVVGSNVVIPKIPIVYTTLLIFIGQFVTALILDSLSSVPVTLGKALGLVFILLGLLYNLYVDMNKRREVQGE